MRGLALTLASLPFLGIAHADDGSALRRALSITNVSELVEVCRGISDVDRLDQSQDETYRLLSCISYVRGAYAMYASYQEAFGTRTFCLPARTSLGSQIGAFLRWSEANHDRSGENASQGYVVSLLHSYPCLEAPSQGIAGPAK